jgi:aryl-alcohol dehydrogenase-like predicted oxidoreductase
LQANITQKIGEMRSSEVGFDFSPASLRSSLNSSLKRLRRNNVDGFLLHDPVPEIICNAQVIETLQSLKAEGKVVRIGVSINSISDLEAVASVHCYDMVQAPMLVLEEAVGLQAYRELIERKTIFLVRQVLRHSSGHHAVSVADSIARAQRLPGITTILVGVSKPNHLSEIISYVN